jgi:predicted amidohydrolase
VTRVAEIACLQLGPPAGQTREDRIAEVAGMVEALAGVDLIVLPEMWPAGYFAFDDYAAVAETADGPTVMALSRAAAAAGAHVVGGSFVEEGAGGALHNTAFVLGRDGDVLGTYRKMHVFGYRSREAELVTGGDTPVTIPTPLGRIGMAVCYDLRFPEFFRAGIDSGAELFVIPAAWPAARTEHWRLLLRARAVENQAFVVGCNGAGADRGVAVAGHSAIIDPTGVVVAEGGTEPGVLRARVDLDLVATTRADFPVLADRRLSGGAAVQL